MQVVKSKTIYVTESGNGNKELFIFNSKPKPNYLRIIYRVNDLHITDGLLYLNGYKLGISDVLNNESVDTFCHRLKLSYTSVLLSNETVDGLEGGFFNFGAKKKVKKFSNKYAYTGDNVLLSNIYSNFTIYDKCGFFSTKKDLLKG